MKSPSEDNDRVLRPHTYDGIQEYDQRLPNWWLFTLYGAIAFSLVYWVFYHQWHAGLEPGVAVESELRNNRELATRGAVVLDDALMWKKSQDASIVDAGKATFQAYCVTCHLPTLTGLIGPNLIDEYWLHGGRPTEVINTITNGEVTKGMPSWGPVLGKQKIVEVTAYIFSFHHEGEPIKQAPPWVPGQPMQVTTPTAGN